MKKLIIAITSAFMLLANSAMSMDLRPAIGISGNYGVFAATGIEKNFDEDGANPVTTKEYGAFDKSFASVFVELGLSDAISVGIDYVPDSIETPSNTSNDGINENKVHAEFEDLTTIYLKLNVPLGGTYIKVGHSTVDVLSREAMNSGNTYGNDKSDGLTAGIGYAHEFMSGLSVRAELTGTEFSNVSAANGQTNKNEISVEDMIGARGTISIVKSF